MEVADIGMIKIRTEIAKGDVTYIFLGQKKSSSVQDLRLLHEVGNVL